MPKDHQDGASLFLRRFREGIEADVEKLMFCGGNGTPRTGFFCPVRRCRAAIAAPISRRNVTGISSVNGGHYGEPRSRTPREASAQAWTGLRPHRAPP